MLWVFTRGLRGTCQVSWHLLSSQVRSWAPPSSLLFVKGRVTAATQTHASSFNLTDRSTLVNHPAQDGCKTLEVTNTPSHHPTHGMLGNHPTPATPPPLPTHANPPPLTILTHYLFCSSILSSLTSPLTLSLFPSSLLFFIFSFFHFFLCFLYLSPHSISSFHPSIQDGCLIVEVTISSRACWEILSCISLWLNPAVDDVHG